MLEAEGKRQVFVILDQKLADRRRTHKLQTHTHTRARARTYHFVFLFQFYHGHMYACVCLLVCVLFHLLQYVLRSLDNNTTKATAIFKASFTWVAFFTRKVFLYSSFQKTRPLIYLPPAMSWQVLQRNRTRGKQ